MNVLYVTVYSLLLNSTSLFVYIFIRGRGFNTQITPASYGLGGTVTCVFA